jgi:copper chaperone CopZ
MFSFFKPKNTTATPTETTIFKISGLHCTSCSLNIDGTLEETTGVVSAATSYAHSTTQVTFDPQKISLKEIQAIIEGLGYTIPS